MEKLLKVLRARQTVGAWARQAMLVACMGIMVGVSGVASAEDDVKPENPGTVYWTGGATGVAYEKDVKLGFKYSDSAGAVPYYYETGLKITYRGVDNDGDFSDLEVRDGVITAGALNITGGQYSNGSITAVSHITTTKGNISTSEGNISTSEGNISTDTGDITTVSGDITALQGTVSGKDLAATNNLTVTNNASVGGDLSVNGESTFNDKVTFNGGIDAGGKVIANVAAGSVVDGSKDAVNGGQIYTLLNVAEDGNYITAGTGVAGNLTALDTQVKANADAIEQNAKDIKDLQDDMTEATKTLTGLEEAVDTLRTDVDQNTKDIEQNKNDIAQNAKDIEQNKNDIAQNAKDIEQNKNDIAQNTKDIEQNKNDITALDGRVTTNENDIADLKKGLGTLDGKVEKLGDRMDKVGATAAALAALHPMDFDTDSKLTFAAGMGTYRDKYAGAIGMFYKPTDSVMLSLAGSTSGTEQMANLGVSFALDRNAKSTPSKTAMANQIKDLKAENAEMKAEIAELKALVQALANK